MKKKIVVVGGANGVGKTTFAYQYRDDYGIDYLGADEIAAKIEAENENNVEVKAGKLFFKLLDKYLHKKESVIIESTLSGLGLSRILTNFKNAGFELHFVYVFINEVGVCKNRVVARVKKGGHNVPPEDIERRYFRSLKNFRTHYLPLADTWQILYNGLKRPIEIAIGEAGKTMILDDDYYNLFLELSK